MKVIVIGGGAAGLIAAGTAAKNGADTLLIEKNEKVGRKLMITGKGRCNITNNADIEDMISQYPTNGKFLYSALYSFTNEDIVSLIESMGVRTKAERGGRIFPESDRAADVVDALRKYVLKNGARIITDTVKDIEIRDGRVTGVKTARGTFKGDRVIVCTGGKSYPKTGSTGDGYVFAEKSGHRLVTPKPSLVPLVTEEKWVKDLMGLSLKNAAVTAFDSKGKKVYSDFGEMLFTHFGVSGPVILSTSSRLKKPEGCRIEIDLKPALNEEKLDSRLLRDFEKYNKKHLINALDDLLPKALIPVVINLSGIDVHKPVSEIKKTERAELIRVLKHLTLNIKCARPIEEAIVTAGGVSVKDIDPSTMESKKVKNLYFAGEVIDIDGYTGGYNLQAAFSTGYLAGTSACMDF